MWRNRRKKIAAPPGESKIDPQLLEQARVLHRLIDKLIASGPLTSGSHNPGNCHCYRRAEEAFYAGKDMGIKEGMEQMLQRLKEEREK